jgi:hypothetical protein
MYTGLHVKYLLVLSDFNATWIFQQIFEESSNIKFHENPFGGPNYSMPKDGRADRHDEANILLS